MLRTKNFESERSYSSKRRFGPRHGGHEHGQTWMVAAALLEGPRSVEELEEYFRIMGRRFGFFMDLLDRGSVPHDSDEKSKMQLILERSLGMLIKGGWALERDGRYHITDEGRSEAQLMLEDLERGGRFIQKGTHPETVSKVTLIVHFLLAAIKFPAALLSGSVGLLNDSLDTFMDGMSSLFVFFGVRSGHERLASYVLLLFMTGTGGFTLYQALIKLLRPEPLVADWTSFVAVAVSAVLCALLWFYQKYSGIKHSCIPLIAQSIDSRNHIIVAGGVAAGLVSASFQFTLLDHIVGIAVAVLILKAAIELLVDLLRTGGEGEIDLSKYGFSRIEKHRHRQMVRWLLYEVEKGRVTTKNEMYREAMTGTDFNRITSLKALGLEKQPDREEKLDGAIREIFDRDLVEEVKAGEGNEFVDREGILQLTAAGEAELSTALSNTWGFFSARHAHTPQSGLLGLLALFLRLALSAALFTGIYAAGRLVLGFLPVLDVWESATRVGPLIGTVDVVMLRSALESLNNVMLSRIYEAGPFSLSGAQVVCVVIGFSLLHVGRVLLHRATHAIHHAREHGSQRPYFLVTDGPYAARRHPMYTGIILINMGIGIGLHSVYTLAWAGLVMILCLFRASQEERKLLGWFGKRFETYASEVKRRFFFRGAWIFIAAAYCIAWLGYSGFMLLRP
jgi:protein-S-isoprenylcysteine O-methyltransferase Ste14